MQVYLGRWLAIGCFTWCCLWAPRPAEARLIYTAPPEDVVSHASHVVRVSAVPTSKSWRIEEVYRGTFEGSHVQVHDLPGVVSWLMIQGKFKNEWMNLRKGTSKPKSLIFALYAMDGRYHTVGSRPGHGVPSHSSVWLVSEKDVVHGFRQVMNPGSPVPVPMQHPSLPDFETYLRDLLTKHAFEGAGHTPLPEADRDAFLGLIEPMLDWYAQRVAVFKTPASERLAVARKLDAYARDAPEAMALPVFEAMLLLTASNGHAHKHESPVGELMLGLVRTHGVAEFSTFILTRLDTQPYMTGSRTMLLWILKETDAALYRRGVEVLRALCLRQMHNEAVAAYWALKGNGEDLVVAEIDKAWAAMEAGSQRERALAEAKSAGAKSTGARADAGSVARKAVADPPVTASDPTAKPPRRPARIEVGDGSGRPAPVTAPADEAAVADDDMPWLLLGPLACVALVAGVLGVRRATR